MRNSLATEQELLAARTKAEDLEKENCDLVHTLTLKEQELDLRTQEKEDIDTALSRLKDKYERETLSHLEAKQKISDLETFLNELGQQLQLAQQEKLRLEHALTQSGAKVPEGKAGATDLTGFQFSPPR